MVDLLSQLIGKSELEACPRSDRVTINHLETSLDDQPHAVLPLTLLLAQLSISNPTKPYASLH